MQQFKILQWKYGGLVVQERHTTVATKLHKDAEIGKVTTWKNIKWPTPNGLMQCMTDLLMDEDKEFGNASNLEELLVAQRRYSDIQELLIGDVVEALKTGGIITK